MCPGRILMGKMRNPAHWLPFSQRKWAGLLSQMRSGGAKGMGDLQNYGKMPKSLENGEQVTNERKKENYQ